MLSRKDMRKEALPFSNIEHELKLNDGSTVKLVHHDIEANGINYITLMFNAMDIEAIGYMGLLSAILSYVDTKNFGFADLSNAINIYTGGISTGATAHPNMREPEKLIVNYEIRIKVLEENLINALSIVNEILTESKFDDVKRLREIVAQTKARLQSSLSSAGHTVASMRSMAKFSKYAYYQDALHGIDYYNFICGIDAQLKENADVVVANIKALADKLFASDRLLISFTGNTESLEKAVPVLSEYMSKLVRTGDKADELKSYARTIDLTKSNEGFMDASQIQYVARTGNFVKNGYSYSGALRLLRIILSYDYLWINVRVKGGAYGCMTSFLRSGESYFVSYRDPNLSATNEVYDNIPDYIRSFDPDERDMTKYIIGTFSALDTPLNPEAKGSRSMSAYLEGIEYEQIQKERDEILNARKEDINALADLVQSVLDDNNICVIGNENVVREASDMFDATEKLYN